MGKRYLLVFILFELVIVSGIVIAIANALLSTESFNRVSKNQKINQNFLVQKLSAEFDVDDNEFIRELESAYFKYSENEQLHAMYCYYNGLFYQDMYNQWDTKLNYKVVSQLYIRQIDPNYNGVLANEINKFGLKLFGALEEWETQNAYYNSKYKKLTLDDRKKIIKWIKTRFNWYEGKYGYSVNDKYTETVFKEAAKEFGFLYEEINQIWQEYCLNIKDYT